MHYICCSCNRGRMIWSLQRGRSLLGGFEVLLCVCVCYRKVIPDQCTTSASIQMALSQDLGEPSPS